jgi:hypothetical protein
VDRPRRRYEHLHEIFWPSVHGGAEGGVGWLHLTCVGLLNLMALPLLPFAPSHWERRLEHFFRNQPTPLLLIWLLPSGRFFLWLLAMICLAVLVTAVPPQPTHFEVYDLGLALYLMGILKAEFGEAVSDVRAYGQLGRYLTDAFNVLDMLLVLLLTTLLAARYAHVHQHELALAAQAELPAQALLALVAWLRTVQVLFIFSKSGPLYPRCGSNPDPT